MKAEEEPAFAMHKLEYYVNVVKLVVLRKTNPPDERPARVNIKTGFARIFRDVG